MQDPHSRPDSLSTADDMLVVLVTTLGLRLSSVLLLGATDSLLLPPL